MSQPMYQGRTYNHLTWAMVDATDFATPESALSAATKIKVYGKLKSASNVHFITSGTGSLTTDIKHVGASVLGLYTIALAKADLSDASAAWYDQYQFALSATGAAYQLLVEEGILAGANASNISAALSDAYSLLVVTASRALLAQSAASDAASAAAQGNSRTLLVQSRLSDFDSRLVSDVSDLRSQLTAVIATLSDFQSDFQSRVTGVQATASDLVSQIWADATAVALASRMLVAKSAASDAASAAAQGNSRTLLVQSRLSDLDSRLASDVSDIRSAIAAITATVGASDISDIASAVAAITASNFSDILSAAAQANSRILLIQSRLSDLDSRLASDVSDIRSAIAAGLTASDLSDIRSAIAAITATISASDISDIASAVAAITASNFSDILSAATQTNSRALVLLSRLSDFDSRMVSDVSDIRSAIAAFSGGFSASDLSDIRSAIAAGPAATVTASDISDIASAVLALLSSNISDILSAAVQTNSRAALIQSRLSDFDSRIVSAVRDILSRLALVQSTASDAASAAQQGNSRALLGSSRALLIQSQTSDIYSLLSDVSSDLAVMSGILSDTLSAATAASPANHLSAANVVTGVCDAGSSTTSIVASSTSPASGVNDQFNGRIIIFDPATTTVALRGQATDITDYVHGTKTFTVTALTTAPSSGDTFKIF